MIDVPISARRLESALIARTAERARDRIRERFPESSLARVAGELHALAEASGERALALGRPYWKLRGITVFVVLAVLVGATPLLDGVEVGAVRANDVFAAIQGVDSGLQVLGVLGAGLFFLVTWEDRMKRRRALQALHELRSVIHVVDMHQLTKDPTFALIGGPQTISSPERELTPYELARYLDYCSELLSLCSKVAALYAQSMPDAVVTDAVSDLERLTANLSLKIWQKITLLAQPRR